jgi:hypothetical protein
MHALSLRTVLAWAQDLLILARVGEAETTT